MILSFLPSVAAAQSKWTLTTADFRSRQVELVSIDDAGAKVADSPAVKWDDLLLLDRENAPKPQGTGKFTLFLTGGDQVRGEPVKLEGETLHWTSPAVGELQTPLKQVAAIVRANQPPPAGEERRTEDLVRLSNGDQVHGIVSGFGEGVLKMTSSGTEVPVPLDTVAAIQLASTNSAAALTPRDERSFRVRLADDSVITSSSVQTSSDKLVIVLNGAKREVPLDTVTGIEQLNGPVSWLSSRVPAESVQTPLLETTRPAKMDRTIAGRPIRFGDHTYSRGIGVTPYSRLTWLLDGRYKVFRTRYAIDGSGAFADVTVRVKIDDKVVHERKGFTAGELSPVVLVPLGSAKSLALEVDFGGNYNVQDRLNWIEPALLKNEPVAPAPATTSAPATTRSAQ